MTCWSLSTPSHQISMRFPACSFISGIILTLGFGRASSEHSQVAFVSVPVGLSQWLMIGHVIFSAVVEAM